MLRKSSLIIFLICVIAPMYWTSSFGDKINSPQHLGRAIYYGDYLIEFDHPAYIHEGDVYVPLAKLSSVLGMKGDRMPIFVDNIILIKDGVDYVPLKKLMNRLGFSVGYDTVKKGMRISRDKTFALNGAGEIIVLNNRGIKDQGITLEEISTNTATLAVQYDRSQPLVYELQVLDMGGEIIYQSDSWQDKIVLNNLIADTNYVVKLYQNKQLIVQKGFTTFSNRLAGNQVYYEISLWDFEKNLIKATIFLYNKDDGSVIMTEKEDDLILKSGNILDKTIHLYGTKYELTPKAHQISLELKGKKTAKIAYEIPCSTLNETFLSAVFKQMLLVAEGEMNNLIVNVNLPLNWASAVGVKESEINNLYKEIPDNAYNLGDTNIYAYHKEVFNVTQRQIGPSRVTIIVDKMYDDHLSDALLNLYFQHIFLWGGYPCEETYSVFVINTKDKIKNQGPKGQSWSYQKDWFQLATQQMYQKWSGWEKGIRSPNDGDFVFWSEGISMYYTLKLTSQLGYGHALDSEIGDYYHQYMADYYGTKKDIAILELSKEDESFLRHKKTVLFAYLLDKEIQKMTKGKKSLDDVLKQAWKAHKKDKIQMTESHFKKYVRDTVGTSMNDWWNAHMYYKRKFKVHEFEVNQ